MKSRASPYWIWIVLYPLLCLIPIEDADAGIVSAGSNYFTLDTRETGAVLAESNYFTLDTRETGAVLAESDYFTLDTREMGAVSAESNYFTLDTWVVSGASVSLPVLSVCPGRTILIPVHVSDVTGLGIHSAEMSIAYDSDVVRVLEATNEGTLTQNWALDYAITRSLVSTVDTARVALATPFTNTLSGSGAMVLLRAIVSSTASVGDSTLLTFERFRFNDGTPSAVMQNGSVTVLCALLGDVSGNGDVGAYDASLILTEAVGLMSLPDPLWPNFTLGVADVSGNGEISSYDAALVLRYVVGMLDRFPAEGGGGVSRPVYAERTISVGGMERSGDGRVVIPLVIDEMEGVISGEFELSWEGAVASEMRTSDLTSDYLSVSNVYEDRVHFSFAGAESPVGGGRIAEILFSSAPEGLTVDRVHLNEGRIPVRIVETPTMYRLAENYPNPFNPETTITYDVAKAGTVRLSVYALTGQLVRTLMDGERSAGSYSVVWDGRDDAGRDVASGVYLCRMEAGHYRAVRKMLLVR